MYHTVLSGHTVYTAACTYVHACRPAYAHVHATAGASCMPPRLQGPRAPLLSLSPSNPPSRSGPVFMRVSMGKGSTTRTRRKIISDLPRARRSCRPPYIARRSVLRRIFEMETHPLVLTLRPAVAIAFRQRSFDGTRKEKKRGRERERNGERCVCSEIGCDRKS